MMGGREEGGGGLLPVAIPACPHRQPKKEREKENIWADCRPHDILSGSLAFPPCRVMCSLPPFPFPPPLPPFPCPSKLRHVISHHKNRGGKTLWRYRCLRVSGTKAACKYSSERGGGGGGKRQREKDRRWEGRRKEIETENSKERLKERQRAGQCVLNRTLKALGIKECVRGEEL